MSDLIVYEVIDTSGGPARYVAARNQPGAVRHVAQRFKARAMTALEVARAAAAGQSIEDATAKPQAELGAD